MNPQNAKVIFDGDDKAMEEEVTVSDEDELMQDILAHSKEPLTPEQVKQRLSMVSSDSDLDIIERVE